MFKIYTDNFYRNDRISYENFRDKKIKVLYYCGRCFIHTDNKIVAEKISYVLKDIDYKIDFNELEYIISFECTDSVHIIKQK